MNQEFDNSEKIEAYLRDSLSPADKAEFEKLASQDPLLQNEITLQKDIISSIQAYRKAELKQRLDNIDVNASPTLFSTLNYLKIAGILAAAIGVVGLTTLLLLDKPKEKSQAETSPTIEAPKQDNSTSGTNVTDPSFENQDSLVGSQPSTTADWDNPIHTPAVTSGSKNPNSALSEENTQDTKPSSTQAEIDDHSGRSIGPDAKKREIEVINSPESSNSSSPKSHRGLNITDNRTKKYNFHYTYNNGSLTLYGNFTKAYELIELNGSKGIEMYMHYNNEFYRIRPTQSDITPLEKVTDEEKIKTLMNQKDKE